MKFFICCIAFFLFSCSNVILKEKTLNFEYDGHIRLDVNLNKSKKGKFIYDMGSPYFCIDSLYYNKNNFHHEKVVNAKMGGAGNTTKIIKLVLDTITYSVGEISNGFTVKTPLLNLKDIVGKDVDGIIGIDTFFDETYKIDFINEKITFINDLEKYHLIPVEFENDRCYTHLEVELKNGKKIKGKFLIDTGSGATILNSSVIKMHDIDTTNLKAKYKFVGGVGGESEGYTFFTKKIVLDKYVLDDFIIDVSTDTLGATSDREYIGLIGNNVLENFDVVFNHKEKKMALRPNKKFNKSNDFLFKSFHIVDRIDIGKGWRVSFIYENTNAFEVGLRLNDIIVSINGKKVEELDRRTFFKGLKLNQKINLEIMRNTKKMSITFILNKFLKNN